MFTQSKNKTKGRSYSVRNFSAVISTLTILTLNYGVQAGELICPPSGSNTFLETNGPNSFLRYGDWWTNTDANAGNQPHMFALFVPCYVDSDFVIEIQLYDPECYQTGSEVDELEGVSWDDASFRLMAPDGITEVAQQTFAPVAGTSEQWNPFTSFTVRNYGCGIYRLYVSVSDDDQNSYKIKVVETDPDGETDNGDEINVAPVKTTYQHNGGGCSTFWFYVPNKSELRLSNFDMDGEISVDYTDPDGSITSGTVSSGTVWNNGGDVPFPPPGGDVFTNPKSGWWHADICIGDENQYIFYAEGAVYVDYTPHFPNVEIDKDDGVSQSHKDEDVTYTIILTNNGTGPALNVVITDTLPTGTNYVSATGNATYLFEDPLEIVTWDMGVLVPSESDTVYLTIHVAEDAISPLENWVHVSHSDVFFNDYAGINDFDQDIIIETTPVELSSFEAISSFDKVIIEWRTRSETRNLGFNILRSDASNGEYMQINSSLIEGAGTSKKTHTYSYEDQDVVGGRTYYYMLEDVTFSGHKTTHGPINATVITAPKDYSLEQNYPNPFNPATTIHFSLKADGHVSLTVYNMIGQRVRTLVDENMSLGTHSVQWNGRDDANNLMPNGVYFYRIEVNGFKTVRRMIFAK